MSDPSSPPVLASSPMEERDALPAGTRFGELEIVRVVGVGGFGIVYLARDHSLDRDVALKEYMPGQLAARGPSAQVSLRSGSHMETFALGLRSFVNEARLLARFDHPSLVKVYRFWEANNTAYMVMPFLQGRTLREVRRIMTSPPDEVWLRKNLNPLFEALEILHREAVYHRDIAPDNILLPDDGGQAVLLDFGAARRAIGDRTQIFTAILKPSYAPIEQYAESLSLRQGPWTDVYAMGAVIHYLLRGVPPPPATARTFEDHSDVLAELSFPGLSKNFLASVDWALAVRPQDRPQSVSDFRDALDGKLAPPVVVRKPAAAPPSSDAFATTVANPTHPAVHELQALPGTPLDTTVLLQPAATKPSNPDFVALSKISADLTAPFKVALPESSARADILACGTAVAPPEINLLPGLPTTSSRTPASTSSLALKAKAAQESVAGRVWPWALPILLLLVAAVAWWWTAQQGRRTMPSAAAAPTTAVGLVPVTPVPVEAKATLLEPRLPVATPTAKTPVAESMTVATGGAKPPAAQVAHPSEVSRQVVPSTSKVSNTTSTPTTTELGSASRTILEPRQPRTNANQSEAQRDASTDSVPGGSSAQRTRSSPMWPPAPTPYSDEQRSRAKTTTSRAVEKLPDSPEGVCSTRSFLLRPNCMQNQCRSSHFSAHPQCVQLRSQEEADQQRRALGSNR